MNSSTILILALSVLLISCRQDNKVSQEQKDVYTVATEVLDGKDELEELPEYFISNDSIFQLKVYKTVAKLRNANHYMSRDSMQYTCLEVSRRDSGLLAIEAYKSFSISMPEHYITLEVLDSTFVSFSEWFLCESSIDKYKFHFASDAFDDYSDSCAITLGYGRLSGFSDVTGWNFINFKKVISAIPPLASEAKKMDEAWLKSHRIEISEKRRR